MPSVKLILLSLVSLFLFCLPGCGSSGGGTFTAVVPSAKAGGGGVPFQNVSTSTGKFRIAVNADRTVIDANAGEVVVTATVTDSNGDGVAGRAVSFGIVAGPATVVPSLATVVTDSGGNAVSILMSGDTLTTTNVIFKATTVIGGQTAGAYGTVKIVRGSGAITFITEKKPSDPDGTLFTLDETFDPELATLPFTMMQQLPFKVTDSQGNPRVGVPVTLSIDNQLTGRATVFMENPTVVTDSLGKGIFNVGVTMTTPKPGSFAADSIIYKAVTTENASSPPLTGYAGCIISYTTKPLPALSLSPSTLAFSRPDTAGTTKSFTVSGGESPYTVISGNPSLVAATVSGSTVTVTLVDASLWSSKVPITVTDKGGKTAAVSVTRE